jgi:AcrR family transcriptional regulator
VNLRLKKPKISREEKAKQTYENLMSAAALVVGDLGYGATSIVKVTEKAGVSHGTFYNYFEDRQALFDTLLPHVGAQMTDQIIAAVPRSLKGAAREVSRFEAYCEFLRHHPGFYRILYESEVFAPKAHAEHIDSLTKGYRRALERSMLMGDIKHFSPEELDAVVQILLGSRAYIAMYYNKGAQIPPSAISAYKKLIENGLLS